MSDIRFQSFEDGELADIWYALSGAAIRHPDHFQPLAETVFKSSSNGVAKGSIRGSSSATEPFASQIQKKTPMRIKEVLPRTDSHA